MWGGLSDEGEVVNVEYRGTKSSNVVVKPIYSMTVASRDALEEGEQVGRSYEEEEEEEE